ncbi:hypothetical protein TEA_025475 [Camellia sinensis var. sinensis]|uniref:Uncharacterized protein n=1 Tax=Camellia sinensis var. sinensis TaxID=542762 RepID=A0A4S4DRT4_CAMSN|nr:hypothetical protein TEA_025475 [Camellia sinensis var. sinensis]
MLAHQHWMTRSGPIFNITNHCANSSTTVTRPPPGRGPEQKTNRNQCRDILQSLVGPLEKLTGIKCRDSLQSPTRPPTSSNKEKSRSIVAGARDRSIGLRFQELERRIKGEVGRRKGRREGKCGAGGAAVAIIAVDGGGAVCNKKLGIRFCPKM